MVASGHLMLRGFMRKIYVHNRKAVPVDKPVLLAANHPTAFVDPCLLCTFIDAPLYNMTRGDVFQRPLYRKLLEGINMFPVYRVRDGYTGRDRNDQVFEYCEQKLLDNQVVTIYVEGEHHLEKRVRPIQKGILRVAFGAYEKHRMRDLQVIPAGCNYVYGDRPRDEVMVNIGKPLYIRDFWDVYQKDPAEGMASLSQAIETELRRICFHLKHPEDANLLEQLLTLHRSMHPVPLVPIVVFSNKRFSGEKEVCDRLNGMEPDKKAQLSAQAAAYFDALRQAGLEDAALMAPEWGAWWRLFYFFLGFPAFLLGFVTSFPVIWLSRSVADKTVKKREFYSSVRLGVGHLGGMAYYALWFLICLLIWNPWWIGLSLMLPALGWFSMFYRENWERWRGARRALGHPDRARLLLIRNSVDFKF
ncbi:MAG: 1-acyl-sn-glycerol-3-phosphate acyltransferase [Saprospirales bacterium]|nr:1-acyl-sn-glycerol-3-phosphate acyltransferase [Saprospirales bacterium]